MILDAIHKFNADIRRISADIRRINADITRFSDEVYRRVTEDFSSRFNEKMDRQLLNFDGTHLNAKITALEMKFMEMERIIDDITDIQKKLLTVINKQSNSEGMQLTGVSSFLRYHFQ